MQELELKSAGGFMRKRGQNCRILWYVHDTVLPGESGDSWNPYFCASKWNLDCRNVNIPSRITYQK